MVKYFLLLGLLLNVFASMSAGSIAFRAALQYKQGNFHYSWNLYERALEQSKKTANTENQGKILINMVRMAQQSLQFSAGDSLFKLIPASENPYAAEHLIVLKLQRSLLKSQCQGPYSLPQNSDWIDVPILSQYTYLTGMCAAQSKDPILEKIISQWNQDKAPGQYFNLLAAKLAKDDRKEEAIAKLLQALEEAQKFKNFYAIANALTKIADLYKSLNQNKMAIKFYARGSDVFERIGLIKPYIVTLEKLLALDPHPKLQKRLKSLKDKY